MPLVALDRVQAGRDIILNLVPEQTSAFSGVPSLPNELVGRDDLLRQAVSLLAPPKRIAFVGMAGVGKTALAASIARFPGTRDIFANGILWAGVGQHPDHSLIFSQWAEALGVDIDRSRDASAQRRLLQNAIGYKRILFILDDVWDEDDVRYLQCDGPACSVVITTRDANVGVQMGLQSTDMLMVPPLSNNDSVKLMRQHVPNVFAANPDAVNNIIYATAGLPLAINVIAAYLSTPIMTVFPELSDRAISDISDTRRRVELAGTRLGGEPGTKQSLREIVLLSLSGMADFVLQNELEGSPAAIFGALGAFASHPAEFSKDAANDIAGASDEILALFVMRNLLQISPSKQLSMHPVMADVARLDTADCCRERHLRYYADASKSDTDYRQLNWAWSSVKDCNQWYLAFEAMEGYAKKTGFGSYMLGHRDDAAVHELDTGRHANALATFGQLTLMQGDGRQAIVLIQESLADSRCSTPTQLVERQFNLARALALSGDETEALECYTRLYEQGISNGDPILAAGSLVNLGAIFFHRDQMEDAREAFRQIFHILEGTDKAPTTLGLGSHWLGRVELTYGRAEQARRYLFAALDQFVRIGQRYYEAKALYYLSCSYHMSGDETQREDFETRARNLWAELGNEPEALTSA